MQKHTSLILILVLLCSLIVIPKIFVSITSLSLYLSSFVCFVFALVYLLKPKTFTGLTITQSELLLLLFVMYGFFNGIYHRNLQQEWLLTVFSATVLYFSARRNTFHYPSLAYGVVGLGVLQALYGILQYFYILPNIASGFRTGGSFDNPAGYAACLAAIFPMAVCVATQKQKKLLLRLFGGMAAWLFLFGIFTAESRTGIVAVFVSTFVWMLTSKYYINLSNKLRVWIWIFIVVLFTATSITLYHYKKDSADGRLLIARCTTEMIKDAPFFGHGAGGFSQKYMLYCQVSQGC